MKTNDITKNQEQSYDVVIDNSTKKVIDWKNEFRTFGIDTDYIQILVDELINQKMITLFGKDNTEVSINIWDIGDGTDDLYIETYHRNPELPDNVLFDDYDKTMLYDEFLNL